MTTHMDSLSDDASLEYQGRKATRVKSEQRRRLILEAALRIVIREGVRGIRHRAVAKEAGVPLAATTYYFKDIQELIVDTFTLYTEKALDIVQRFASEFYQPLQNLQQHDAIASGEGQGMHRDSQDMIIDYFAARMTDYIRAQALTGREMLVAEQAFRYEAIVNPQIGELAKLHRRTLFERLEEFMTLATSKQPGADAELVLGMFHSMEYAALLAGEGNEDFGYITSVLKRHLTLLIPALLKGY